MLELTPDFYNEFSCIGSDCEETCCKNWTISLDKQTYQNYKKSSSSVIQKIAKKDLILTRTTNDNWAHINLNENEECPALTADKLCGVHKELGGDALPDVCKIYPRAEIYNNSMFKHSLTLSCPEAARKVLLNPAAWNVDIKQSDKKLEPAPLPAWFDAVYMAQIDLAINGSLSLEEKLFAIGLIVNQLPVTKVELNFQSSGSAENNAAITNYIQQVKELAQQGECKKQLDSVDVTPQFHGKSLAQCLMWTKAYTEKFVGARGTAVLKELFNEYTPHLSAENEDNFNFDSHHAELRTAWQDICEPFFDNNEHILINLLVHQIFSRDFPYCANTSTPQEAYLLLIVDFLFLRGMLSAIALKEQAITEADVIKVVYTYYSGVAHNPALVDTLKSITEGLGLNQDVGPLLLCKF